MGTAMPERPPWDPSSSDGCSVPSWLRILFPDETEAQRLVCLAHDEAYYYGGSRRLRAIADAKLLLGLLEADMDVERSSRYHSAVRMFGRDYWWGGYPDAATVDTPSEVQAP